MAKESTKQDKKTQLNNEIVDSGFSESGFSDSVESVRNGVEFLRIQDRPNDGKKKVDAEVQWNSASITIEEKVGYVFEQDEDGDSLLHLSVAQGCEDLALKTIELASIESINAQNAVGQTPLMIAVLTSMLSITRKLIDVGADLRLCDRRGNNILHVAAAMGLESSLKEMFTLSCFTNPDCLRQIYSELLESRNYDGLTPLHLAVKGKHFGFAYYLKELGVDVNCEDYKAGYTPLHHLVQMGNCAHVQQFIDEFEPNLNAQSYSGITPLQLTYGRNMEDISYTLILSGADTEMQTEDCPSWSHYSLRQQRLLELEKVS